MHFHQARVYEYVGRILSDNEAVSVLVVRSRLWSSRTVWRADVYDHFVVARLKQCADCIAQGRAHIRFSFEGSCSFSC